MTNGPRIEQIQGGDDNSFHGAFWGIVHGLRGLEHGLEPPILHPDEGLDTDGPDTKTHLSKVFVTNYENFLLAGYDAYTKVSGRTFRSLEAHATTNEETFSDLIEWLEGAYRPLGHDEFADDRFIDRITDMLVTIANKRAEFFGKTVDYEFELHDDASVETIRELLSDAFNSGESLAKAARGVFHYDMENDITNLKLAAIAKHDKTLAGRSTRLARAALEHAAPVARTVLSTAAGVVVGVAIANKFKQ